MEKGTIIGLAILLVIVLGGLFLTGIIGFNSPTGKVVDNNNYVPPSDNYYCGDNICNGNENCNTCLQDCGECPKQYKQFVVKAYAEMGEMNVGVPFWQLPSNPDNQKTIELYEIQEGKDGYKYSRHNDGFYVGSWLAFYTDYEEEDITCEIKEYYDSSLNSQFTSNLKWMGSPDGQPNQIGSLIDLRYEDDIKPSRVRYDYTCMGLESNNKYSNSYTINLVYPN